MGIKLEMEDFCRAAAMATTVVGLCIGGGASFLVDVSCSRKIRRARKRRKREQRQEDARQRNIAALELLDDLQARVSEARCVDNSSRAFSACAMCSYVHDSEDTNVCAMCGAIMEEKPSGITREKLIKKLRADKKVDPKVLARFDQQGVLATGNELPRQCPAQHKQPPRQQVDNGDAWGTVEFIMTQDRRRRARPHAPIQGAQNRGIDRELDLQGDTRFDPSRNRRERQKTLAEANTERLAEMTALNNTDGLSAKDIMDLRRKGVAV